MAEMFITIIKQSDIQRILYTLISMFTFTIIDYLQPDLVMFIKFISLSSDLLTKVFYV